jgi:large subunit ribosomal protein L28
MPLPFRVDPLYPWFGFFIKSESSLKIRHPPAIHNCSTLVKRDDFGIVLCSDLTETVYCRDKPMPRVCEFTGKKSSSGNTYTIRGKAKYLGGVGTKVTGKTKRTFKPNIQVVQAVIDGETRRVKVSAKALRTGVIVKPLRRKAVLAKLAAAKAAE